MKRSRQHQQIRLRFISHLRLPTSAPSPESTPLISPSSPTSPWPTISSVTPDKNVQCLAHHYDSQYYPTAFLSFSYIDNFIMKSAVLYYPSFQYSVSSGELSCKARVGMIGTISSLDFDLSSGDNGDWRGR